MSKVSKVSIMSKVSESTWGIYTVAQHKTKEAQQNNIAQHKTKSLQLSNKITTKTAEGNLPNMLVTIQESMLVMIERACW